MNYFKCSIISICLILSGCMTGSDDKLETYQPTQITFDEIKPYSVDTSELDALQEETLEGLVSNPIFANISDDGTIELTFDETEANAVVIYSENWAKVADMAEIADGYRNVVKSQEELIKVKDETIRSLQQLVLLQQQSRDIYRENFILADSLYKSEHKLRMREKVYSEIRFVSTILGIIAVGVL